MTASAAECSVSQERWSKALLAVDATVRLGICNLEESGLQIALVVSDAGVLLGTLTDGDIRRGLLRGLELSSPIESIVQRDPLIVPAGLNRNTVVDLMHANRVHQLPIVDEERRVVGLHLWDAVALPGPRPNVMVLMAGGEGVRLRPHTETCPKPLLPVGGKPMLEHIIERAKAEGFQRFVIAVRYLGEMIENYFRDGSQWQIDIEYLHEKSPLGTAGALGLLDPRPETPFVVSNGDVLTDIRYGALLDFHCRNRAVATMAVRVHEWQIPFGIVQTRGVDIVGVEEKPVMRSHINAGVYVLDPSVLDVVKPSEQCDMPTLFTRLQAAAERTIVYPMYEPWLDVGRVEDYVVAQGSIRREAE